MNELQPECQDDFVVVMNDDGLIRKVEHSPYRGLDNRKTLVEKSFSSGHFEEIFQKDYNIRHLKLLQMSAKERNFFHPEAFPSSRIQISTINIKRGGLEEGFV